MNRPPLDPKRPPLEVLNDRDAIARSERVRAAMKLLGRDSERLPKQALAYLRHVAPAGLLLDDFTARLGGCKPGWNRVLLRLLADGKVTRTTEARRSFRYFSVSTAKPRRPTRTTENP